MLKKIVSKNVKRLRTELGLTQQQLADRAHLHVQYVSKLENESLNITLDMLEKMAKALEVQAEELLGERSALSTAKKHLVLFDEAIEVLRVVRSRIQVRE